MSIARYRSRIQPILFYAGDREAAVLQPGVPGDGPSFTIKNQAAPCQKPGSSRWQCLTQQLLLQGYLLARESRSNFRDLLHFAA